MPLPALLAENVELQNETMLQGAGPHVSDIKRSGKLGTVSHIPGSKDLFLVVLTGSPE